GEFAGLRGESTDPMKPATPSNTIAPRMTSRGRRFMIDRAATIPRGQLILAPTLAKFADGNARESRCFSNFDNSRANSRIAPERFAAQSRFRRAGWRVRGRSPFRRIQGPNSALRLS